MITSATGAANLGQYYALGQDNYYKTIRENGFETFGSGRETYGLEKGIKEDHFHSLAGQTWNKDLQRWEGGREVAAKDLTVEIPKSLSLLYELTDDPELRDKIREAIEEANKDTLRTVEESGIFRVKVHHSDGTFSYHQAENMVVGIVPMHNTSRAQDPHLHIHDLFANTATIKGDTSGKEYAVDFSEIKRNHKFLDNVFHSSLADKLRELGIQIEMLPGGQHFRVVGITREQELEFSKRQAQIKENLWAKGIDPKTATTAQRDVAWRETRAWKTDVAEETLRAKWSETAQAVGLDLSKAYTPPFIPDPNGPPLADKDLPKEPTYIIQFRGEFGQIKEQSVGLWEAKQNAINTALDDCAERMGVFKRRDVYRAAVEIAKEQGHALTLRDFKAFYSQPAEKLGVLAIGTKSALDSSFIGEKLTTQKFLDAEKSFLENIKELAAAPSEHPLVENAAHKINDWNQDNKRAKGWTLKTEQAEMVEALCGQESIVWVQGRAGAGKTTALTAAADIVGRENIFGLAFQGKAAQVLQDETGIESSTIHRFLGQVAAGDKDFVDRLRGGVLVIDEVGMVGTIHAAQLTAVAKQYGMRLWGVGDTDQYQSVSAGSPMYEAIVRGHGQMVELSEVTRQASPEDRKMVSDIAQHHAVAAAVKHLSGKDAVHEIFNREQRHAAMINQFADLYAPGESFAQIITPENSDRARLNALAHDRLRNDGVLKGQEIEFTNFINDKKQLIGSRKICAGEKILFTKNSNEKQHGISVKNGEVGVVTGLDHNGLRVVIGDLNKDGREIVVDINKYRYLDQAWAITGHKSQGMTEKKVIVEARGKLISLNSFYVMVSRHKDTCHIFTDDKFKLVRAAQAKQSKMSALGIQEDMAARITGHAYADAISNAFLSREERDAQTRHKIGQALGEEKAAFWHLVPKDLRDPCNKEFDSSLNRFAMDLAAAKSSGIENDAVTQRLTKAYEVWLDRHATLKKNFKVEVSKLKEKANGKNVDKKIDALTRRYRGQHAKNDSRLLGAASEYNPDLRRQLEIKRAIEMHAMDEDSTTLEEKQARVRGEVVDPLPTLRPQAEAVRQAVVIHDDAAAVVGKEKRESRNRQERRGRDGLSERQETKFKRRYDDVHAALAAKIAEATGEGPGTVTFRREFEAEAKRHAKAMEKIGKMKADDAKKAGVKIRDLRREEMAQHHGALDGVVISHESRSPAAREIRDLELAHRERMRELATSRKEAEETAKAEGRKLTPEETKRDSALRNIEEKRFRGELALVGEKHGLTPEYAYDVREHYRQQGQEVKALRQAEPGGAHEAVEAKRGESDKVLADLEAADRQRPKILSEIKAAQREHAEERSELNRAHAEERERLNALGVTPGAEFKNKCNAEHAVNNARLDAEINGIIDKYAHHDPEAAQALRDTMAVKVIEDAENRKLSGALAKEHGGFDNAPQEEKNKIIQGYRDNEARRDERLVEIERSMGARQAAIDQGQEAPAHTFGEIKPHDARPEIIRDIQSTLEAHESKKYELKRAQKEEGDKLQTEGKELSKEWNDAWNAKYQNANAEFQREINQVVEKYAGKDPQAAAEIRSALDEQQARDLATRKESGALARAHGNDFKKVPVAERDKIVAQYREHEQHRNDRLMAAQRGIVERQAAAPSPAPTVVTAKPEVSGPEFSHGGMSQAEPPKAEQPTMQKEAKPDQAQAQAPQAEHQATMDRPAERLTPEHRPTQQPQARPEPSRELERPKVAPIPEPSRSQPSPTLASSTPEPAAKLDSGPEFSHGDRGSLGEKTPTVSPGQMSKGAEPPAHLTTTPEIRAWWDDQRSMVGDAAKTSQEASGAKQSGIDGGKVAESPKTAAQAPQAAKVAINLPPPPDWNQRYAEASDKAARDIAVEKLAAGPAPVPAKPAEDVVAKAEAEAKALEAAMRESRERETARMKERAKQDAEKYGPRVAAASDEIIRGTVVEAQIKGGRLNVVVDCGNGRYRVAALPVSANVTPGQSGELRQQQNGIYSFTASNFQNLKAVSKFDNRKNDLLPDLNKISIDMTQRLSLNKTMRMR